MAPASLSRLFDKLGSTLPCRLRLRSGRRPVFYVSALPQTPTLNSALHARLWTFSRDTGLSEIERSILLCHAAVHESGATFDRYGFAMMSYCTVVRRQHDFDCMRTGAQVCY
jgi:hypothetical protein